MKVIEARNVHEALPKALLLLDTHGVLRESRNGYVKVAPFPVTTTYLRPTERVLFWERRDANPFFHLYEAMWMLAGQRDVESVSRYAKQMATYSDDGKTFHGAYGYRWRVAFGYDQLHTIINTLRANKDDRRAVLSMWDPRRDLGQEGKDFPCNVVAHFQRDKSGALSMTVFNRSNDIIWGCYGANAVHFSVLQEYIAGAIGCEVGPYYQISNNWHAYVNDLFDRVSPLAAEALGDDGGIPRRIADPYLDESLRVVPLITKDAHLFDYHLTMFMGEEARGFPNTTFDKGPCHGDPWFDMLYKLCYAHKLYREAKGHDKFLRPMEVLMTMDPKIDWVRACEQWLSRRYEAWRLKLSLPIALTPRFNADIEQV